MQNLGRVIVHVPAHVPANFTTGRRRHGGPEASARHTKTIAEAHSRNPTGAHGGTAQISARYQLDFFGCQLTHCFLLYLQDEL
jgi:hypothetical protein